MEIKERIEREKELLREVEMVRKLATALSILTIFLIVSNAFWVFFTVK